MNVSKPFASQFVDVRGAPHHVTTWGDPHSPPLMFLHGWMDVGASFQFLVDALAGDWYAIAPDLRGFGHSAWQPQGYWFYDYVADLEALVDRFFRDQPVRLVGHSLGGNIVMNYAGVRHARVHRVVSLEGFGIPAESPDIAPRKIAAWLDAMAKGARFSSYDDFDAVADRLQEKNPRLPRDRAEFLAKHWAAARADGRVELVSDPRHKLPFPHVYRPEEVRAIMRSIVAPVLWVAGEESEIPRWLAGHGKDDSSDGLAEVRRRLIDVRYGRLATVQEAGHMLHHDQPAAVAALIEPFLGGSDP